MSIEAQEVKFAKHLTIEFSMVDGTWMVTNYFTGPPSEKLSKELEIIQYSVNMLLRSASATELDSDYYGIDTELEASGVTVNNGLNSLSSVYEPFKYPYSQAYDISKEGIVTVTRDGN